MVGKNKWWLAAIYFILGLYFLNAPISFIKIPTVISGLDPWIIFIGGFFLIIGGINHLRVSRRVY